jgi:hypothetical protein
VEDALHEAFAGPGAALERPTLPVSGDGILRPGVDLDDNASLLDLVTARGR